MSTSLVTTLTQRAGTLNKKLAAHLLRRCSFRITRDRVDQLAGLTTAAAVNNLFNAASPAHYIERPLNFEEANMDWIPESTSSQEGLRRQYVVAWWFQNALLNSRAHHKSAFFLHTIFATGWSGLVLTGGQNKEVSRYQYDHFLLLHWLVENNASLKTVARKMTLDNMMLGYLDNRANFKVPDLNENYGREFLELFTIGRGEQLAEGEYENYNETDVTLAAKVFTGFTNTSLRNNSDVDPETGILRGIADPSKHEPGDKVFSSKFGGTTITGESSPTEAGMLQELDDFIDMVFAQPATAHNFARKMYSFYVSTTVDEAVVMDLADDLLANGYDFISTIKKLLKSVHFYSHCSVDYGGGNILKSPFEILAESMSFFDANLPAMSATPTVQEVEYHYRKFGSIYMNNNIGENSGMHLFSPISVAGYPAYYQQPLLDKNWYSSGTIPTRFGIGAQLVTFNGSLFTEIDTLAYVIWLHEVKGVDVSIADNLMDEMVDYLFPQPLTTERYDLIKGEFLMNLSEVNWFFEWFLYYGGGPENFPGDGDENRVRPHTDALVKSVLAAHEFQLK